MTAINCSQPGCRNPTADLSGACHHHRGASVRRGGGGFTSPTPSMNTRTAEDPSSTTALATTSSVFTMRAIAALAPGASAPEACEALEGYDQSATITVHGREVTWSSRTLERKDTLTGLPMVEIAVDDGVQIDTAALPANSASRPLLAAIARSHPQHDAWEDLEALRGGGQRGLRGGAGQMGLAVEPATFEHALALGAHVRPGREVLDILVGRPARDHLERYRDLSYEADEARAHDNLPAEEIEDLEGESNQALSSYQEAALGQGYTPEQVDALAELG